MPNILNLKTFFISYFHFDMLYNLSPTGGSMFDYKHTEEAKQKMKTSKFGELNPMYGKTHTAETKLNMSNKKSSPVVIYYSNNQYVLTFKNNIELFKFLGYYKFTVSKYIKSGKLFKGIYYIKKF